MAGLDRKPHVAKTVFSKATLLSLSVIAACPQSFWFFRKERNLETVLIELIYLRKIDEHIGIS